MIYIVATTPYKSIACEEKLKIEISLDQIHGITQQRFQNLLTM